MYKLSLAKTITGRTQYYLLINNELYIKISKKLFAELIEYLKIEDIFN